MTAASTFPFMSRKIWSVTVVKSARNIPGVVTSPAKLINVYDLLNAKTLVIDKDALAVIEEVFA